MSRWFDDLEVHEARVYSQSGEDGSLARLFDRVNAHRKSVDVKIVLTSGVQDASLATALERLRPWREDVQLILQPVTPFGQETRPLPAERLLDLARLAVAAGFTPRVIPQVHKVLQLP